MIHGYGIMGVDGCEDGEGRGTCSERPFTVIPRGGSSGAIASVVT